MIRSTSLFAVVFLAATGFAEQIEVPDWDNSVTFRFVASQEPVRPGDTFEVAVLAEIVEGYHLYGPEEMEPSRTEVSISGEGLTMGEPSFPPVITRELSGLGTYDLYEGDIVIRVPLQLDETTKAGERTLEATVNYQVCTDFACSAPTSEELSLTIADGDGNAEVKKLHPEIFGSK